MSAFDIRGQVNVIGKFENGFIYFGNAVITRILWCETDEFLQALSIVACNLRSLSEYRFAVVPDLFWEKLVKPDQYVQIHLWRIWQAKVCRPGEVVQAVYEWFKTLDVDKLWSLS